MEKNCKDALERKGIEITGEPVYILDELKKKELAEKYKGRPYGDVRLNARLICKPES